MKDLLFEPQNIKHPDDRLGPIIEEIERLGASGKLQDMLYSDGTDAFVEDLIYRFCYIESNWWVIALFEWIICLFI